MKPSHTTHRLRLSWPSRNSGSSPGLNRPSAGVSSDIVAQAGRIRQRPAWTFLERWLPLDIAVRRQGVPRAAVLFAVLSLLVALLAAAGLYVGSPAKPAPLPSPPNARGRA